MTAPAGSAEYCAAVDALFALKPRGAKLGIDRMRLLAEALDHPERTVPCIHIGGTNGKGSVAAMVEAILRQAGFRVGLYTSPHLVDVGERVQIDRRKLSPAELLALLDELKPIGDEIGRIHGPDNAPSFFELMTAMAFLRFARERCDLAVVEVGLGGEFDATNVVLPEVSVITSIGLDHCEWLGGTVEQIARTKAGIIKPRRPVVIGRMSKTAETVIREIASWHEAPVHSVREIFGESPAGYPATNLAGDYQRWNAATAVLAVQALAPRWQIGADTIATGLMQVQWAARWQEFTLGSRRIVLDAAHNADGATVLDANLRQFGARIAAKPVVVVGALGLDRAKALLPVVAAHAREIYLVEPDDARAVSHEALAGLIPAGFAGMVHRSTVAGLFPSAGECRAGAPSDAVVVTGSIHLLGEVLAKLQLPV